MPTRRILPPSVYAKGRWYWRVVAKGKKRVWIKLSPVADGLPSMYAALANAMAERGTEDKMPALIAAWKRDVMPRHKPKTQRDESARLDRIADAFAEFRAEDVRTPDVSTFLETWRAKHRTFNAYRADLRELMRYAIERGLRTDNPVAAIRTLSTPARRRYITDSELRRVKAAAMRGADGKRTRAGPMTATLLDLLYLTGQRIGDVLALRWTRDPEHPETAHVTREGLRFFPTKTEDSTGASVVIAWTPALRAAVDRLAAMRSAMKNPGETLIAQLDGQPLDYFGASTSWKRACARAGVKGCTLHDIRAKALTDKDRREGMSAARTMGTHSTEAQTATYVRARSGRSTGATR